MSRLAALPLLLALVPLVAGCSDDAPETVSEPDTTAVSDAPPVELFVTEDLVRVGPLGIHDAGGDPIVDFDASEQACIAATAPEVVGAGTAPPDAQDDPDREQALAEAVVECVDFDRLRGHVRTQLADQPVLEGVDPDCLDAEIESLRTQPDVLAAIVQGDESGRPAVAGTIAENCST